MLVGIFIGIFIGVAIALAVTLIIKGSPSPFLDRKPAAAVEDKKPVATAAPAANPVDDKPKAKEKPRFDFYTILPGIEEPVSEKDIKQQDSKNSPKSQYFLQAGAFQSEGEADNLKAKLALMGVEASIQTATVPGKGIWHRVRVGPYSGVEELNKMRTTLTQNGVSSTLVKVNDQAAAPTH